MPENSFFRKTDPCAKTIAGFDLPVGWWSRGYEYEWSLQYNLLGGVVANMGAGWTYRPMTDALAKRAGAVYSVDSKPPSWGPLDHPTLPNVTVVIDDMTKQILKIPPQSLDRIFCISVFDEMNGVAAPLREFTRLLSFGGLIVLTFDVQYDMTKPLKEWPGVNMDGFFSAVEENGLSLRENIDMSTDGAIVNEDLNLSVFHCVLEKK